MSSLPSHCPKLNDYFTSTLTCIQSKTAPPSAHFDCSGEINFHLIHKFKRRKLHCTNYSIIFEEKEIQKNTHVNLIIGLGGNGAKIFFFIFSCIFYRKNDHFNSKLKPYIH